MTKTGQFITILVSAFVSKNICFLGFLSAQMVILHLSASPALCIRTDVSITPLTSALTPRTSAWTVTVSEQAFTPARTKQHAVRHLNLMKSSYRTWTSTVYTDGQQRSC